ncbi:MAG: hypothetical protein AAFP78_09235, partial [Pseudomonadota bacterium]
PVEEKNGFFSAPKTVERAVMIFGRQRRRQPARAPEPVAAQPAPRQPGPIAAPVPAPTRAPAPHVETAPEAATAPELGGARRD